MQSPADIIDLQQYPLDRLDQAPGRTLAERSRDAYRRDGLCLLPGFVRPAALTQLVDEADGYLEHAWFCDGSHNAYLSDGNGAPARDALDQRQERTFVGSVPYDRVPASSLLQSIYQWDPLRDFIGQVLGKSAFHRFEDPFGACSVNVFREGGVHGWHFDESEFTVTLMLQAPESGGEFEYVPMIRGLANERAIVGNILDGGREGVVTLPFTPGTLLIFGGRQTLHRVTRVNGSRPRLVPVLCYAEQPGMQNSPAVRKLFWGRANPEDSVDPSGLRA